MDFHILIDQGVITEATRNWLEPQWEKEQAERKELEEALGGGIFDGHDDDEDDDDVLDHNRAMIPKTITIGGVTFSYCQDDRSVGHGNRVWHASIATCLYLKSLVESSPLASSSFHVLELGAGTALPSLFLAQVLAKREVSNSSRPFLHVTDSQNFRNIQQILWSIGEQSVKVQDRIAFRVSPHNWGQGIGVGNDNRSFLDTECPEKEPNRYDVIIVSDCIYNPNYHVPLLESVARMLKFPDGSGRHSGGRAIISFSLHGNTTNETVWDFLDLVHGMKSLDQQWRLAAAPVSALCNDDLIAKDGSMEYVGKGGWNMEDTMKKLDLWAANLDPQRWIAYLYEVTWTKTE